MSLVSRWNLDHENIAQLSEVLRSHQIWCKLRFRNMFACLGVFVYSWIGNGCDAGSYFVHLFLYCVLPLMVISAAQGRRISQREENDSFQTLPQLQVQMLRVRSRQLENSIALCGIYFSILFFGHWYQKPVLFVLLNSAIICDFSIDLSHFPDFDKLRLSVTAASMALSWHEVTGLIWSGSVLGPYLLTICVARFIVYKLPSALLSSPDWKKMFCFETYYTLHWFSCCVYFKILF